MSTARMRQAMEPLISTEDKPLPKRKKREKARALTNVNDFAPDMDIEKFGRALSFIFNHRIQTLSNDDIQSIIAISLTCKDMHKWLDITNINSPLYRLEPDFLLDRIKTLLRSKSIFNDETRAIKDYLESHVAELEKIKKQKSLCVKLGGEGLEQKPPASSKYWNHAGIEGGIWGFFGVAPFITAIVLAALGMLPGVKEFANDLVGSQFDKETSRHYEGRMGWALLLSFPTLVLAYGLGGLFITLPAGGFLNLALESLWLKMGKHDLKKMDVYPTELLARYDGEYEKLTLINKVDPTLKKSAFTLFSQVSALSKVKVLRDIEAPEPQLRLDHN